HTRSKRDWSSDVCSSDLLVRRGWDQCGPVCVLSAAACCNHGRRTRRMTPPPEERVPIVVPAIVDEALFAAVAEQWAENRQRHRRSEERRVGKECRCRCGT